MGKAIPACGIVEHHEVQYFLGPRLLRGENAPLRRAFVAKRIMRHNGLHLARAELLADIHSLPRLERTKPMRPGSTKQPNVVQRRAGLVGHMSNCEPILISKTRL